MPGTLSRSLRNRRSRSNTDTPSTITSTSTTRESTPEIDSKPTPTPSAYSLLTQLRLRRRPRPLPTRRSPPMFSSPKYTPLPTSSGPQRKRAGGGLVAWKRWALLGTVILVLLVLGYSRVGGGDGEAWEAENTYTPVLDDFKGGFDEIDYSSPPFRPVDSDIARPHDDMQLIEPVIPDDDYYPGPTTNPHDPTSDQAQDAAGADPDFTQITDESEGISSFEEDPDPTQTVHCDHPYDETKSIVQYALTIDAGSTGSRIHVYKFHNCGPSPQLEYETFKSIQPGVSAYARDPSGAAASLDPLLEEAYRVVPIDLRKCTPVEVKATAGLRLLGNAESQAMLDEIKSRLETKWEFVVGAKSVEIMDGKDEGVYSWITANYLVNKIGEGASSDDTLAVMDLGGASTQIVFEPTFPAGSEQQLIEGEHKYQLNFGGKTFTLYQHSYLGYGLMRARRSVHNLVAFTWSFGQSEINWDELSEAETVSNPCLSRGTTRRVELDPPGRKSVNVTMHGAMGGFEACNRVVELVMAKDAICEVKPCSFNGVYQPSLLDTFPQGQLLALSYFTDRIKPLLSTTHLTIGQLTSLAQDVCAGHDVWTERWGSNPAAMAELEGRPEYCLDLTFMNALLGLGYELTPQRALFVAKKLRGVELGWALGAGLALVEKAELTCTV